VLTAILSYTELCLMKLPEDHAVSGHLNGIREASEKAAGLTHQLLAFSRKQALSMQAVDLTVVVESMAGMLKRVIGEDVELRLDTSGSLRTVLADVGQVEQVIMNLAVNARDAMPAGGTLLIGTTGVDVDGRGQHGPDSIRPGGYVLLTVRDSGAGMPREVRDRIFEPFFTTKEVGMGTGLGLATVYGIVKQHNGYIFVDSDLGRGTEFRLYLPAGSTQPLIPRGEPSAALPRGSETVLVVEDDPLIRGLLREVLESFGYQVIEAGSGPEAAQRSGEHGERIDLLLTDVVMPGMNGRELADLLRRDRPGMRVLYLSGYTQDILTKQGVLEAGAALIQKPLTTGMLAQTVRRVLDGQA
jgi:CheY-like chemotaxis protein